MNIIKKIKLALAKNLILITIKDTRQYFEPSKCKHKNIVLVNNPNGVNKSHPYCLDCNHINLGLYKGKSIWQYYSNEQQIPNEIDG